MEIGDVHHIGYLVKDIKKSLVAFQVLDYKLESDLYFDQERCAYFCFLIKDNMRIELVEPKSNSEIFPLFKTYNDSIYHICYQVFDIDKSIVKLKHNGFLLFKEKKSALAISEHAVVAFLMHARMGIIELLQE